MSSSKPVVMALSGGVDSAVAALLLKRRGVRVEALFMKNWEEDDENGQCAAEQDLKDATAVCRALDIPLHTVNLSHEYWDLVFERFLEEHRRGRTPNPDVLCNREIKFAAFWEHARKLGADRMATGHYAAVSHGPGGSRLLTCRDQEKDQTYFLYALEQDQLARTLFPLSNFTKSEVRGLAARAQLSVHDKKDSTGICFIGERRFSDFLARYLPPQPGDIVSAEQELLGKHQGLMFYTLGQRQGIGLGGGKGRSAEAWYVIGKDLPGNRLIVGQGHDHPDLYHAVLLAESLTWIAGAAPASPFHGQAKIRYRHCAQECEVQIEADTAYVRFSQPQRAVTPGQSVVFYQENVCLGGGVIATPLQEF